MLRTLAVVSATAVVAEEIVTNSTKRSCDVTVIMVRHGERIDETWHQGEFRAATAAGKVWIGDPWLSNHGVEQTKEAAENL